MAKRSKRRTSRHERDQAGCISGIINIFHFRQGRATKRLLTDRKEMSDQAAVADAEHSIDNTISPSPAEICECLEDTKESQILPMTDANKTSVKELMEVEMFNEKGSKQPNDSEQVNTKSGNFTKKKHKKKTRSSAKSSDMDFDHAHEQIQLGNNIDLERILKELDTICKRLNTDCSKHELDFNIDEEKLVQAVKLFIEQNISDNNCCSEELIMDALQTLSLNKGLFLKLLQDPNSELFKHVQDSEEARLGKEKSVNLKPDELSSLKNQNLFTKRTKSLESYPLGENKKDCQSPSKIVILMPGLEQPRSLETDISVNISDDNNNVQLNEKNVSQFSFTEIKRKLKNAMGKERPPLRYPPKTQNSGKMSLCQGEEAGDALTSDAPTEIRRESFGWRSPNRNHFYTERFTLSSPSFKKGELVGKLKDDSGKSNINIEARKHLSEMVKSGDENTLSKYGNNPVKLKPLGRILSLPEYNVSPCPSPRKPGDDIFLTAQMRLLSPRGTANDNPSQRMQNSDSQPRISCSESKDKVPSLDANESNLLGVDKKYSLEIECFNEEAIVSEVQSVVLVVEIEQTNELRTPEEANIVSVDTREKDNKESASPGSILHLSGEDQLLSSPAVSPPYDREHAEIEDPSHAMNKIEQPSPVSVLEALLTDDVMSPARTISQPVETEILPRRIHFEEEELSSIHDCTRISLEDEESSFEYVEVVLLGSDLNWDEFLLRWVCASEILDQALFEEVKLFSGRPLHDQKLLFDCANETLKEVCECYFGCFATENKANSIRRAPKGMNLINDVWRRVEWYLSQNLQPHSLDQLVKKDLAGSKDGMNIRLDMEIIVFDMEESIFGELVEEIVLSLGVVDL